MSAPSGVRRAAWLSRDVLLVLAGAGGCERTGRPVEARRFAPDGVTGVTLWALAPDPDAPTGAPMTAVCGPDRLRLDLGGARAAGTDLRSLLREELAGWPARDRSAALAFLAELPLAFGSSPDLGSGLRLAREALRERRPVSAEGEPSAPAIRVDAVCAIGPRDFFVHGTVRDAGAPLTRLLAHSPEGEPVELSDRAVRFGPGLERFACRLATRAPSAADGWVVEAEFGDGSGVETPAVDRTVAGDAVRRAIVASTAAAGELDDDLLAGQVEPALEELAAGRLARVGIAALDAHGPVPDRPTASLVVRLADRVDLLEHHLVHLEDDREMRRCDVIFVADRPRHAERARELGRELGRLYAQPFRLAVATEAVGAPMVRALGTRLARAPELAFLDVGLLPTEAGWLPRLLRFKAATPGLGALAPRVVGPDDSIVEAGVAFEAAEDGAGYAPRLRLRGLHADAHPAGVTQPLPAVGPGCLVVGARDVAAVGGFAGVYGESGYDVAELCLRLGREGRPSWYVAGETLVDVGPPRRPDPVEERCDRRLLNRRQGDVLRQVAGSAGAALEADG